jgi:hypothetical protein
MITLSEAPSPGITTASNGLSLSPSTNVKLGGTLIQNTTINTSTFDFIFTGTPPSTNKNVLSIVNNSTVPGTRGLEITSTGITSFGARINTKNTSLICDSEFGQAGRFRSFTSPSSFALEIFKAEPTQNNTNIGVLSVSRYVDIETPGSGANGISGSIDFSLSTTTLNTSSTSLQSTWYDANTLTRKSKFIIVCVDATTPAVNNKVLCVDGSQKVGVNTINPTSSLQVVGLQNYADNTAAVTAGLTAGAFYIRTGHGLDIVV